MSYYQSTDTDSDIHLIDTPNGGLECVGCSLSENGESFILDDEWAQWPMTVHLVDHVREGHKVPQRIFDKFEDEIHA